jgi:gamma-glutamylcyclotransferase (GGCT)/AIG2-like uncharacterized protein YtfP
MKTLLFTYGTLMNGHPNHHYCRNAISIEKATVCGKLYQLSAGYPALQIPEESILSEDSNVDFKIHNGYDIVHGELVTFTDPDEILPIDRLEGVPHYYRRVLVPVQKSNGQVIAAWVYTMDDINFSAQYLPDGVWPEVQKMEVKNG